MVSDVNKKIARNTFLLYVRTLFTQMLSLYISRKVLEILGVEDYGIYNVVGSVIAALTFLNGSMAVATQRFLTIELGNNNLKAYNQVFCMSCQIHITLSFLILIVAETLGLWFVNNKLNIPVERIDAANWVYHTAVLSVALGIIQTPYVASLTAHEQMNVYAYVGMGETVLRLAFVLLLLKLSGDKLILYAILMLVIQLFSALIYRIYCITRYSECRFSVVWDKALFKSLLGFTGWNLFGTLAWMMKDQGINLLMNIFGGPFINAARGVSYQIANAVQNLVSGFGTAVNPQLTKNYASGDTEKMERLLISSSKISYYLLWFIGLPVMLEIGFILNIWLVNVPDYTELFTKLIFVEALLSALSAPIITSLLSTGKIKWYQIVVGSVMLINVPISYLLYRTGVPVYTPFVVSIVISGISFVLRLHFCKSLIGFSVTRYLNSVLRPVLMVTSLSLILPFACTMLLNNNVIRFIIVLVVSSLSIFLAVCSVGLTEAERLYAKSIINSKLSEILQ